LPLANAPFGLPTLGALGQGEAQISVIAAAWAEYAGRQADVENSADFASEASSFLAFSQARLYLPEYYFINNLLYFNSYISSQ
jgi:hypothetical protein